APDRLSQRECAHPRAGAWAGGLPPGVARARLGGGTQSRHRVPLCRGAFRAPSHPRCRVGRSARGRHIVTEGSEGVQAAQHTTQTIPIVMRSVAEPVQRGFIASLARPGGNITGLAGASGDLSGKRLELLKEAIPTLTRVAVLWNPPQPAHAPMLKALEDVAQALGLQLHPVAVHRLTDFEGAFTAMRVGHTEALMILGSDLHSSQVRRLADLALQSRLPAMAGAREFADSGGCMTYGPSARDALSRVAYYVVSADLLSQGMFRWPLRWDNVEHTISRH